MKRSSSWLSPRIQLFPEWKPLLPRHVIPPLWAHPALGPGHTSRGMRQPSLVGCLLSTQRTSSPAGRSEREPRGDGTAFRESRLQGLGGRGGELRGRGLEEPRTQPVTASTSLFAWRGGWPALEAYSQLLCSTLCNLTIDLASSNLPRPVKKIK